MSFSLETLEFARLLDLVARNAQTPMGAERIHDLLPISHRPDLERSLAALDETTALIEEKQVSWSFSGLEDPSDAIAVLKVRNSTLEPLVLLDLVRVANQALFARSSIQPEKDNAPVLWSLVEHIPPQLLGVLENINRKLLPGGEIDDSASPELARIRRELSAQRARLTKSLESVMRSAGDAIQDQIVTVRNDRYVIPVKADFRGKVGGVAHGFSSSGQTVFVEPLDAIEANNEIQNLKGKEEREISRILFALTESLREQLPAVEAAAAAVAELDAIRAKFEFSRRFNATVPAISDDGVLDLTDARHPLLSEPPASAGGQNADRGFKSVDGIVPNSFKLTADRSVMIISGANAGGKTVVLKTAGLLSLMALAGLPVPAKSARVPLYRSVLADIGDHQSLAANLSTFSSHMSNIADMMQTLEPPALVLLDEAGTGTDPEEGSALGVAIVDHFRRNRAHVIASTHYRGLKMYAANDSGVVNASVEFDEKTLQPTYRLLLGLAGASSGIEIARRFGIRQDVIDYARENLDLAAQEAEAYLRKLQNESKLAQDLRLALEEEREATAKKYATLDLEAVQKEKARRREFEQTLAETVEAFERQSKAFLDSLEDKALKSKLEKERSARKAELNRAVLAKVESAGRRIGVSEESADKSDASATTAGTVEVGSTVLTSLGKVGTVEKIDKGMAEVLVGNIRLREKHSDLQLVHPASTSASPSKSAVRTPQSAIDRSLEGRDAPSELNLIGKTTAEAEYELDRYIDEAYIASLPRVRIIHGFGTGALKNYVHHFLKNHELVERFAFASADQGGNGATVAELKL